MKLAAAWPALRGDLSSHATCERGVWGKVHGAASDFRWIGRSAAFAPDRRDLPVQLNLDREDAPARFTAWRSFGDRCYAVAGYPSRAIDATGRRGFLEKQVLEWRRPPSVPAALGALALLPHIASLTDDVWWERRANEFWTDPDACLALDVESITIDSDAIGIAMERGRQQLRDSVSLESLVRLYAQLLSVRRPALLGGVQQPLPAEALAALLLPLPREIADHLSLAGWIPAERPSPADLGKRWDVLAIATPPAYTLDPAMETKARRMAEALWSFDATVPAAAIDDEPAVFMRAPELPELDALEQPWKPGHQLELTKPPSGAPPIIDELHAFAASADRRWLAPQSLKSKPAKLEPSYTSLFASWVQELGRQKPPLAHSAQWNAKIDVLRSAAIVLIADGSVLRTVGIPDERSRVPALLFGPMLDNRQRENLARLREDELRLLFTQSARCAAPKNVWDPLRRWLDSWTLSKPGPGALIRDLINETRSLRPS
jgi:hypothetical protein